MSVPRGPLHGLRIVEIAGQGPTPFAAMMLADHGAEVIRVDRPGTPHDPADPLLRSRRSIVLDFKSPDDVAAMRALCRGADGLIEGFRPGVMERLGLGPEVLLVDNPALVYGRMTGFGQDGPYSRMAGHDINYIAIAGPLAAIGRKGEPPVPPLNLVGDFGGGGMMLAFGMLGALLAVARGGGGQVVDCAMTDGSALMMAMAWNLRARGFWTTERGANPLDGAAPFYDVYETADGRYMAVGAIEEHFWQTLCAKLGVDADEAIRGRQDPARYDMAKAVLADRFRTRTQREWMEVFDGTDACCTPVLAFDECAAHPHNVARGTFIDVGGHRQPAPAPRYSATPLAPPAAPRVPGEDTGAIVAALAGGAPSA